MASRNRGGELAQVADVILAEAFSTGIASRRFIMSRTLVFGAVSVLMISTALAQQPSTSNPAKAVSSPVEIVQSSDELLA
jgi:hypothetical protein